ncbi:MULTISPECIES: pirin family protein [Paraburkholderia]|jgi:redox-sensitive bicupin YhaK (pirin superfamily)|uniref:Pirin domain-containing protein n=1 Tax=Paraburkholderia hospita TaxID=169430 RepID=A0AAJ4VSB5_9BURK|nr:pirin family protein [Paraburkholderia hospita]AUT72626.1 pirin family protein [Paraburkholderia hospita]AXF01079.1 pirin family protein [Paraburkholderia hospita]EIM93543.1 pirin domain-containing protein [Paraburkholderia hospita]OUL89089.1 quercetin 2,3-dioxygenase [Paraburkholderia hospita]OUL89136.1 quercetin 2,3-dioxygenase [Paraburkholderia hospita]
MIDIRHANERGRAEHGWLSSRHTFSFANYYDPKQIGFSDLLVINDDRVAPGRGFGKHPHRDMEIFSYVLEGALEHKDSMGTGSVIVPGDVQLMSAGTGVAHSEFNHSASDSVHFLQIWIAPSVKGATPRYLQQNFSAQDKRGKLRLVLSPEGTDGSLELRQDARVYAGLFDGNETAGVDIAADRFAYVHVARGSVKLNGVELNEGDGARIRNERRLEFTEGQDAEVLVFDLRNNEVSELWS